MRVKYLIEEVSLYGREVELPEHLDPKNPEHEAVIDEFLEKDWTENGDAMKDFIRCTFRRVFTAV